MLHLASSDVQLIATLEHENQARFVRYCKFDAFVKSSFCPVFVIPAKAGIQVF